MKNYAVGITFGVFDLFHIGHLRLLQRAKEQCTYLIVGVSTDDYVLKHKQKTPAISYLQRKDIVLAIKDVDLVIPQCLSFTKQDAITIFKPDVIFVGSDWTPQTFTGANLGIPVVYFPRTEGISSTELRDKWIK